MQKTKAIKIAVVAVVMTGIALTSLSASAASNWKDYFDKNEAKSIKKLADDYVRDQIDGNSSRWKGLISAKQVDSGISKRKVYSGTMPNSMAGADKTVTGEDGPVGLKKISSDVIVLNENPQVTLYTKVSGSAFDGYMTIANGNIWKQDTSNLYFADGEIWIQYGHDSGGWIQHVSEYKIVVNY